MSGAILLLPLHLFVTFTGTTFHLPSFVSTSKTRENGYSTRTRLRSNSQQFDARNSGISCVLCLCVRVLFLSLYCYFEFKKMVGGTKRKILQLLKYLLFTIVLIPGGSSTVHIYTQTIHRTTQLTTLVGRLSGI
jgi:hypothetical protein